MPYFSAETEKMDMLKVYIYFPWINTQQQSTAQFNDTPVISPPNKHTFKDKAIKGSADHCEEDCDSDLNRLASLIMSQYTSITNQC